MEFRKSSLEDIEGIMDIIKEAQAYLKREDIDQWQNGYPNEEVIRADIGKDESYGLVDDNIIMATTVLSFQGEATYKKIYQGQWLTDNRYGVIHRIAVGQSFKKKSLAGKVLSNIEDICREKGFLSLRIDTHKKNIPMRRFIEKNNFIYCGIIYLKDGNERMAFEKVLDIKKC